jgi:hypothetical protein
MGRGGLAEPPLPPEADRWFFMTDLPVIMRKSTKM